MATYTNIKDRYSYLKGESDATNLTTADLSHINQSIQDIVLEKPFSWNVTTSNLTLSSGTANLPTDYNPKWSIDDARIVGTNTGDDNIFRQIDFKDRDTYSSDDYVYWITRNTTTGVHVFNTLTQSGTVAIYYHFFPADLSAGSDVCNVPDGELVAYWAAAKNWVGDERNTTLQALYEQEAKSRIDSLYIQDVNFGPMIEVGSILDFNNGLQEILPTELTKHV